MTVLSELLSIKLAEPIKSLPAPSPVLSQLMDALDDAYSTTEQICQILESDQSTVARLLAVANSAFYNMRHQVNSISRAVVLLGVDEVRSISLGTVLLAFQERGKLQDPEAAKELWLHSLAVQEATRLLAEKLVSISQATALTAGLLHDMGWVVIMAFFPEKWALLKRLMNHDKMPAQEAALHLNSWHQEAGGALAKHWDLPPMMTEVMARHHSPDPGSSFFEVSGLVSMADHLACELGYDGGLYPHMEPVPQLLTSKLGLSGIKLNNCREELKKRYELLEPTWSGMIGMAQDS